MSALLLVMVCALFVAAEVALVKVRPTRIEELARRQIEALDVYLAASRLGITLTSLGLGWTGALVSQQLIYFLAREAQVPGLPDHRLSLLLAAAIFAAITLLHVVIGERAPTAAALRRPERLSLLLAYPLYLFTRLFALPICLLNAVASLLLHALGLRPTSARERAHSEEELRTILTVSQQNGVLKESELDLVQHVFTFADKRARDVMVPRVDMAYLSTTWPLERVMAVVNERGFTRFPLCQGDPDHIVGMVHVKDLLALSRQESPDLRSIARELLMVPESKPIDQLLREFQARRKQMAIVLDEFGGTAGLVTLEDVLEEIVGEIEDEFEQPPSHVQELCPDRYLVDGKAPLEELRERIGLQIASNGVDTLGGYVLEALGGIPSPGDRLEAGGYRIEVRVVEGQRVRTLQLTRLTEPSTEPASLGE